MFQKKWLVVIAIILLITAAGCGGEDSKKNNEGKKTNVSEEIKNLKDKELAKKVDDLVKNGDLEKAILIGEAAIKKEPRNIEAMFALSTAYYYKNDMTNMLKVARQMEKLSPQNPAVLNQVAWGLIESGQNPTEGVNKARLAVRNVILEGKSYDMAYIDTIAYGLYKAGKKKEAKAQWLNIISRTESGEIYLHYAQALIETGETKNISVILNQGLDFTELQLKDANINQPDVEHLKQVEKKYQDLIKKYGKKSKA